MHFSIETVRAVAQILNESNLGEITLESGANQSGTNQSGTGARLSLHRAAIASPQPVLSPAAIIEAQEEAQAQEAIEEAQAIASQRIRIESPTVGVFRAAKVPLQIGDEVGKKALLGSVETLNIPTDLLASQSARVVEVLALDGQGVEWGQTLLILEPLET